jgi:hypothetical protein
MTPAQIHKSFNHLLRKTPDGKALRRQIAMPCNVAAWYRHRLKTKNDIRIDTKLKWLQKAGIDTGTHHGYTRMDVIAFSKFAQHKRNAAARKLGMEYLFEKWEATQLRRQM